MRDVLTQTPAPSTERKPSFIAIFNFITIQINLSARVAEELPVIVRPRT